MSGEKAQARRSSGYSLRRRLLVTGFVILAVFMLVTGFAIEAAYRDTVLDARDERLLSQIYLLMGITDIDGDGRPEVPVNLAAAELSIPESGHFAAISDASGAMLWQSRSWLGAPPDLPVPTAAGEPVRSELVASFATGDGIGERVRFAVLSFPVIWELDGNVETKLAFHAAEDTSVAAEQVAAFRRTLQLWLGGAAICLLALQLVLFVWLLRPLRKVGEELAEIESGRREFLGEDYPAELHSLTGSLNALVKNSQRRLQRYRNGLADLAHSLKTPLAVMRNLAGEESTPEATALREQVARMEETIEYQLQRASTSGRSPLSAPVAVAEVAHRIADTLGKVYRAKALQIEVRVPATLLFRGDKGDLLEMLGNLGDNACKWANERVVMTARERRDGIEITVADDGPGIAEGLHEAVLRRGVRADTRTPGQGIGLAVVREMVEDAYAGELEIGVSSLGGATVTLRLP